MVIEHTAEVECGDGGRVSEREISDTDPPRGAEREARLYGQAFLVERVLPKYGGVGRADDPCLEVIGHK